MKRTFTLCFLSLGLCAHSQTKVLTQAIISTKTTIVAPEDDDNAPPPGTGPNGEEIRIMRFGGEGETKSTTWLKNDLVKTFLENEMGRTSIIRDNNKKVTTTILEMMGKKTGFYATDAEQEIMRKRMDSMMQSRNSGLQTGSSMVQKTDILYIEDSKKIAGYDCKKALIVTARGGKADTSLVWYVPGLLLKGLASTGGGFSGMLGPGQAAAGGFEQLNGFPMQVERNMGRGRKMTIVVTKMITDKEIADKEFEIPKDIEIKSMKDMQNGGMPGTFQMRIGG